MSEISRDLETWRAIAGFEGHYEVSDHGRVRSLDREVQCVVKGRPVTRRFRGQLLKPQADKCGYLRVRLSRGRGTGYSKVQVLVLETFVGSRPEGMESLHADDDQLNNSLENLRWGTHQENMLDQVRNGRHHMQKRERCPARHLLQAPNLEQSHVRMGRRNCLTCVRARGDVAGYAKRGKSVDLAERMNFHYVRLMGTDDVEGLRTLGDTPL